MIIPSFFIPKDLFYKSFFTIQYILETKIMATILANIYTTGYSFIDKDFTESVCQILEMETQRLIKPKQIQKFHGRAAKLIRHAIYPILIVGTHTESFALLLITKLENHSMILGWL